MPTKREREYYRMGYDDGIRSGRAAEFMRSEGLSPQEQGKDIARGRRLGLARAKPKRKLSAWQKYIKNKRNHIKYRDGKLNLKKMAVAFRRKKRR